MSAGIFWSQSSKVLSEGLLDLSMSFRSDRPSEKTRFGLVRNLSGHFGRIPAIPDKQGQANLLSLEAPTSGAGMTPFYEEHLTPSI